MVVLYRRFVEGSRNDIFEYQFENGHTESYSSFEDLLRVLVGRATIDRQEGKWFSVSFKLPCDDILLPSKAEPAIIFQEIRTEDKKRVWDALRRIPVS